MAYTEREAGGSRLRSFPLMTGAKGRWSFSAVVIMLLVVEH